MTQSSNKSFFETMGNVAYALGLLTLAAIYLYIFLHHNGINTSEQARFIDMVQGRAARPYVYRCLAPGLIRLAAVAIPPKTLEAAGRTLFKSEIIDYHASAMRWEEEYLVLYLIAAALLYGCVLGFMFATRYLFEGLYRAPTAFCRAVPPAALLGLIPWFKYTNYIYDPLTLFLFTLGLGLLARARWPWFLTVYFLACVNKETTILLTLVFALYYQRREVMGRGMYWRLLAAQLTIFLAVKGTLTYVFRHNPGGIVEYHFSHTWGILTWGYSMETLMTWVGMGLLIFYRWPQKHLFLRRGIWIAVPLLLLTSVLGFIDEKRDYYEVYPILFLLAVHSIAVILNQDVRVIGGRHPAAARPPGFAGRDAHEMTAQSAGKP